MPLDLNIQNIVSSSTPSLELLQAWAASALDSKEDRSITLRIVDEQEIQALNRNYRAKDKPTNVLSFPNLAPIEMSDGFLGDIVICASILENEAKAQSKTIESHWAHLIIHSTLHLQGYDHEQAKEAQVMESLEIKLLHQFGYSNPYLEDKHG